MKLGNEKQESRCTVNKLWSQWGKKVIKEGRGKKNKDGDLLGKYKLPDAGFHQRRPIFRI
jgi:hypothetical protein